MKSRAEKQFAGVWIDTASATIIAKLLDTSVGEYSIRDKVQASAGQGRGSEHTMSNAKRSEQLKYFKTLSHLLLPFDEILLFGPGQSQEQFQNHLQDDIGFRSKLITIQSSDQMTPPERIAQVREFFKGR